MTAPARIPVALGARGYDILVGAGLIAEAGALMRPLMRRKQAVIVTDENVARLHLPPLERSLGAAGLAHHAFVLPPGEETKSFAHYARLAEDILGLGIERGTMLVALGGGVIGDLAGFAAATLLRGIDFVQVPTTLLAQVDSSVGGKTAIDTRHGKNLVGAFHQPRLVLADSDALATLPERELRAGYAEIVKYGVLGDPAFFAWLESHGEALLAGDAALRQEAVVTSCRAKAAIVAADERESGARALLNLGHTFGHALEAETGFGAVLLHGEGVAIGMCLALDLSVRMGWCPAADAARLRRHLARAGLPTALPRPNGKPLDPARLLGHMRKDKKARDGRIALVLARGIGRAFVSAEIAEDALLSFLGEAAREANAALQK
ncbi:MAG TPA: 3-dehydroquinate synthase [Stellaceae bacterium]|nr:3-dehydroquinate synthase [Stellaceae bacterium]